MGTVAFVKKAVRVWFDIAVWLGMMIVEVVFVDVTLYMVRLAAEVIFIESNCQ